LLGTSTICVITSGSRTAYVAFFAFLFYWWFFSRYKLRWLAVALIVGAVGLAVVPDQYKARFESITGEETESHSKAARLQILEDAWHIFLQNPLGVGVASFPAVRYKTYGREQDTHNLYLEVATNLGVQGLAAFFFLIWVMMTSYRTAYRRFRAMRRRLRPYLTAAAVSAGEWRQLSRHARDLEFMMAVCVAAAGFIFVRLVLGLFGMDLYEVYWWFGAGMVICLMNLSLSAQTNTERLLQGYGPA
jgi:putative inorganic carbon (HCO3(-)) transporter